VSVCARVFVGVCVCVRARARVCVCARVRVCVCVFLCVNAWCQNINLVLGNIHHHPVKTLNIHVPWPLLGICGA